MTSVEILKSLIKIPSYIDSKTSEAEIGAWIYSFLKKNTGLRVIKQPVCGKRFNIIATMSDNPKILITGHIDTVQPGIGWSSNPFKPVEKCGKIYGLGASDMKSGLAVILSLATKTSTKDCMYLFYCDEEYDFLGMKAFIMAYKNKIKPKIIISADEENLQIGNSCRGLIEMTVKINGISGHAANPNSGINAITQSAKVIQSLKRDLKTYKSPELGTSTLNIAFISGGKKLGVNDKRILLGREGNIIPDYCEYVIEIRVASNNLSAQLVEKLIRMKSNSFGLKVISIKTRHNLGPWITPAAELSNVTNFSFKKRLASAKKNGYIDIQMLWETYGKVPMFTFGPGEKGLAHKPNEFVQINNLEKAEDFYTGLLDNSDLLNV